MSSSSLGGRSGFRRTGGVGGAIQDAIEDDAGSIAAKWQDSCRHFVQDNAEGKQIGARVEFPATDLLGRHIRDGA